MAELEEMSAHGSAVHRPRDGDLELPATASVTVPKGFGWMSSSVAAALGLVPGTAHLYVGRPVRAFVWSGLFLVLCVPLVLLLYLCWGFDPAVRWWIAGALSFFYLVSVRGPVLDSLLPSRRARLHAEGRGRYATLNLLGAFSVFVLSAALLEVSLFRRACVHAHVVESDRLAPVLVEGTRVKVLLSTYVRPVHGEVVLFRRPSAGDDPAAAAGSLGNQLMLGRVVACPYDTVASAGGSLFVNEIGVDPVGALDRKALEKAGRRERRKRLLRTLTSPLRAQDASPNQVIVWRAEDWEAVSVPPHDFLVVPDVRHGGGGLDGPFAWLVHDDDIVGRVVY